MRIKLLLLLIAILVLGSACTSATASVPPTGLPTQTQPPPTSNPTPTLTATPTPALPAITDFMKGLAYFAEGYGGDTRLETDWTLKNVFLPTGANWIRLSILCNQDTVRLTKVYCKPQENMSDDTYLHLVSTAHSLGLRVLAENQLLTADPEGYWAGDIGRFYTEAQWSEWFASYGEMILHYASLAEKAGTDYMVIVSELDSTTARAQQWRDLIAKVRSVYHGRISMAFDEEAPIQNVKVWDALDAIGVHPYFLNLPGVVDPSVEQLTTAYAPAVDRLAALSKKWDKPVILTEVGVWSVHTFTQNYNNLDTSNQIDLQEQSDILQAVFKSFSGKDWFQGIFLYAVEASANFAEPWNIHNDFIGKPAEDVIRSNFGAPPRPTPTPVITPDASLPNVEVIYSDHLHDPWMNYPPQGDPANIQMVQSDIAVNGSAIKVKLLQYWTLDLNNDSVDWDKYQWLSFDLYVAPQNLPQVYTIGVTLRDTSYHPALFKVELLQSQFIEGGKLAPGTWQHVQIPLDVFGPRLSRYRTISIDLPGAGRFGADDATPLYLYVDNVVLSGK
jgi:hypothetical protein